MEQTVKAIKETSPNTSQSPYDVIAWGKMNEYLRSAKIPEGWRNKTFKQLNGSDEFMRIVKQIESWDFKKPCSLALLGKTGTGKSHIAMSLLKKYYYEWFIENPDAEINSMSNTFLKESDLFYEVIDSYKDRSPDTEKQVIDKYVGKYFLIIDDLFSTRENEFARRVILDIIDKRIDWHERTTVITSNLNLEEIAGVDRRIASRLSSGLRFEFKNQKDYRIK